MAFVPAPLGRVAVLALVAVAAAACSLDTMSSVQMPEPRDPRTTTYAASFTPPINVAAMSIRDSGLFFQDFTVGTGDSVTRADTVGDTPTRIRANYRLWLVNGAQIDSNVDPTRPLERRLVAGQIIEGWRSGLLGMRVGGRRRLVMSPFWGYRNLNVNNVPPNSILIFDVTLQGIVRP